MAFSTAQLQHFEERLIEERERLLRPLRDFTESEEARDADEPAGNLSKVPTHPADLGTDTQDEELQATLATRRSQELAEIDAALERLARTPESFGIEERSGEPIPYERLDVIPWARNNTSTALTDNDVTDNDATGQLR